VTARRLERCSRFEMLKPTGAGRCVSLLLGASHDDRSGLQRLLRGPSGWPLGVATAICLNQFRTRSSSH
jgi:hypothetical protein